MTDKPAPKQPIPEPPPRQPDLSLIGYIEKGPPPAGETRSDEEKQAGRSES